MPFDLLTLADEMHRFGNKSDDATKAICHQWAQQLRQHDASASDPAIVVVVEGGCVTDVLGVSAYDVLDWDEQEGPITISDEGRALLDDEARAQLDAHNAEFAS